MFKKLLAAGVATVSAAMMALPASAWFGRGFGLGFGGLGFSSFSSFGLGFGGFGLGFPWWNSFGLGWPFMGGLGFGGLGCGWGLGWGLW